MVRGVPCAISRDRSHRHLGQRCQFWWSPWSPLIKSSHSYLLTATYKPGTPPSLSDTCHTQLFSETDVCQTSVRGWGLCLGEDQIVWETI